MTKAVAYTRTSEGSPETNASQRLAIEQYASTNDLEMTGPFSDEELADSDRKADVANQSHDPSDEQ